MEHERFKSFIAVLTAIVTIFGASAACLSTVAVSGATDEDFLGMSASINAQKAEVIDKVNAYEHYRAFTSYKRYNELGNLLWDEAANADTDTATKMKAQSQEYWGLASEMTSSFFLPRYLKSDETYDVQRELDEAWAEDEENNELDATPHFDKSDALRSKSSFLAVNMITFAVAFWFLTLAQVNESRWKYLWSALGIGTGLLGVLAILIVQVLL